MRGTGFRVKPDWRLFWNVRRNHQFTNCLKYNTKLFVIFPFHLIEATRNVGVRGKQLAEADKGSHNQKADGLRPRAVQNSGRHEGAMFGERPRQRRREFKIGEVVTVCYHLILFSRS